MTAPERPTAGAVRNASVAYFLPPDWPRVARHLAPALERAARDLSRTQLLVLVPDASAAGALARAISTLDAASGLHVVAATSAARARRLLAGGPAHVVVGEPTVLAPLIAATALKLDAVASTALAGADALDIESPELAAVMTEVPRTADRMVTALTATPAVEALIERYAHRARRVVEDVAAEAPATPTTVRYLAVAGDGANAVPGILDEVDPPSAAVLVRDAREADAMRATFAALGYRDEALVRVTEADVPPNTALVIAVGVPTASVWTQALAAQPAQVVAVVAARELPALRLLAGTNEPQPYAARAAVLRARAADARARAELREVLVTGIPTREVLALEPLLGEHDALEIAAAALRLLERTRASQAELVAAAEQRVRTAMREAQQEREAAGGGDRPRSFMHRGAKPDFGSRGDRPREGRSGPGARSDRPRDARSGPGARDDRPRDTRSGPGARGDRPRGPRPPHRDDRPPRGGR